MKKIYITAGLAMVLASCTTQEKKGVENNNGVTPQTTQEQTISVHDNVATALKYVDTDGVYFSLNDTTLESELFMKALKMADTELAGDDLELPKGLKLAELYERTRLNYVRSVSSSVKKVDGGWKNKTFYDTTGMHDGVWSLFKGSGKEWAAYEFAPEGTDLVQEFDLNVENFSEIIDYLFAGVEDEAIGKMKSALESSYVYNPVLAALSQGMHLRFSLVAKLDSSEEITFGDVYKMPNVNAAVKVEGVYTLFQENEGMLREIMTKEEKDGLVYYRMKAELPAMPGVPKPSPVLVVNPSKKEIWAATHEKFLENCLSSGPKLKDEAQFVNLMKDLSTGGNAFTFVSSEIIEELKKVYNSDMMKEMRKSQMEGSAADVAMASILNSFWDSEIMPALNHMKGGIAHTVDLNKDGVLISSRTPIPMKDSYRMNNVMVLSGLAAISTPIILRQVARGRATTAINNAKDISVALSFFARKNNGMLPGKQGDKISSNAQLRKLFAAGCCLDELPFYVAGLSGFKEGDDNIEGDEALAPGENIWVYVPGVNMQNDHPNTPVLMAPFTKDDLGQWIYDEGAFGGQMVVLRADGSAIVHGTYTLDDKVYSDLDDKLLFDNGKVVFKPFDKEEKRLEVAMPELP